MTAQLWDWEFRGASGDVLDRPLTPAFSSRFDAEAWLGEHWRTLAGAGVATAQVRRDGDAVGGPVPMRAG